MMDESFTKVARAARKHPLWLPLPTTRQTACDRQVIERILPHRGAMLLLDAITAVDLAQGCLSATRRLHADDPGFAGHFPGNPIYPASLQLELAGQAGVCLLDFVTRQSCEPPTEAARRGVRVIKVHVALMLAEVRPGDELTALVKVLVDDEITSIFAAQLSKDGIICSFAIVEVCFVDP